MDDIDPYIHLHRCMVRRETGEVIWRDGSAGGHLPPQSRRLLSFFQENAGVFLDDSKLRRHLGFGANVGGHDPLRRAVNLMRAKLEERDRDGESCFVRVRQSGYEFHPVPRPEPSEPGPKAVPAPVRRAPPGDGIDVQRAVLASRDARETLEPWLPRQSRQSLLDRVHECLETPDSVVALVGPAGFGKSTVLGELYDALSPEATVLLVPCALVAGLESLSLSRRFAEVLDHPDRELVEVADAARQHGPVWVLIDTVDLILAPSQRGALRTLLRRLVEVEARVVFTCRTQDFATLLSPPSQHLAGVRLERFNVPGFDEAQVRSAARQFIVRLHGEVDAEAFAEHVVHLRADRRPVQEIVENPLLLGMLCDLFGPSGSVPPDLTVSLLYERYWDQKVTHERDGTRSFRREKLCARMGRGILEQSVTRFVDATDHDTLLVDDGDQRALQALISEGVLVAERRDGRVRFFHQTLGEYAAARSLLADRARRHRAMREAQRPGHVGAFWWPVLRQVLAMVDELDLDEELERLDLTRLTPFRTAVLAAAARGRVSVLQHLAERALGAERGFQDQFLIALESVPAAAWDPAWPLWIRLLEAAAHRTAVNAGVASAVVLCGPKRPLDGRLVDLLEAARRRGDPGQSSREITGKTLRAVEARVSEVTDSGLVALMTAWPTATRAERAFLCRIGLAATPRSTSRHFLEHIMEFDAPEIGDRGTARVHVHLRSLDPTPATWIRWLHRPQPRGWGVIVARAAAAEAKTDALLREAVLQDLFTANNPSPALTVLRILVREQPIELWSGLRDQSIDDRSPRHMALLRRLGGDLFAHLPAGEAEKLRAWLIGRGDPRLSEAARQMKRVTPEDLCAIARTSGTEARKAMRTLNELIRAGTIVEPATVAALLDSRDHRIRLNAYKALDALQGSERFVDEPTFERAAQRGLRDDDDDVAMRACEWIQGWVGHRGSCPRCVIDALSEAVERLLESELHIGRAGRLLWTLRVVCSQPGVPHRMALSAPAARFLRAVDLGRLLGTPQTNACKLLAEIARYDRSLLPSLAPDVASLPLKNAKALCLAIRRVDGSLSPLLDTILARLPENHEVFQFVVEWRGA